MAETRAKAYADGIVTEAEQNAINEAQARLDALQIGSVNLISKKMMLKWNEKNKDIAVWGQDEDGIYLDVTPKLLFDNFSVSNDILNPIFDLNFKVNTQYVLAIEWKSKTTEATLKEGLIILIKYTDGGKSDRLILTNHTTSKTTVYIVTQPGRTIQKISSSYGYNVNALIYNISLIEGNKPLQGFPVAEEDQTGANNVNLTDGTKEFTVIGDKGNWAFKELYVSKIKPNTVYYVNAGNIQNLVGNPDRYSFVLYNKDISTVLCPRLKADKNGGFLITYNNFTEQEGRLLCYAGIAGYTLGNSVKFTEVMLVEGFLPAPVWTPSFSEQQAEIKTITKTLTEIKAENGEISLRVNEVSERVEEAKQEANVMKTEFDSQITQLKNSINLRVTKTDYNNDQQIVNKDISDLQINYNQISSTVSKIINGTQEISGVVTQSNFVTIFSSNKNALGQEVIESINVGGGGVTIDASRINLNGAISANGNVQITTDGKLIAVNGQFTGKITATEGEIAGLKLSNNGLRSSDFNASSKIGSCYAKDGFSVYASGSGVLTPSTGGMQAGIITAVGDFISHITGLEIIAKETSYNYGSSSKVTALRIQAENRYYGTPFDPPLAIEVVSGDVLFGGKMTVNNTSIFRGQIYLNLNNIPNISGASNYYLCINRSTGQLSYR